MSSNNELHKMLIALNKRLDQAGADMFGGNKRARQEQGSCPTVRKRL